MAPSYSGGAVGVRNGSSENMKSSGSGSICSSILCLCFSLPILASAGVKFIAALSHDRKGMKSVTMTKSSVAPFRKVQKVPISKVPTQNDCYLHI